MTIASKQINVGPAWAISATAEAVRPVQAVRDAGLAIDGKYEYQTANWLYRAMGENIGELRDRFVFADAFAGFFAQTAIGTTGAGFTGVKVCTADAHASNGYFVAGLNTSSNAYEVYAYDNAGTPTVYSNTLPAALVVNDIIGDTSGNNKVMVIGSSGSGGKAYRASAANTWTDVTATLFPAAASAAPLRRAERMSFFGNGFGDYTFVVGDSGLVFFQQAFNINSGFAQAAAPTGMAAVNFKAAAFTMNGATYQSASWTVFLFGNSRHVMTYAFPTTTQLSNVLPSSVSAVNAATNMERASIMVVGGARTDGRAFIAFCSDLVGSVWTEIDPDVHGITSPITELRTNGHGGLVAIAGGTLYGGFPDEGNPWKALSSLAGLTDVVVAGYNNRQIGTEEDAQVVFPAMSLLVGIPGTTPVRVGHGKSKFFAGRTMI